MIKFLVRAVFGVVLLAVLAVAGAYVYINRLAKVGIERGGEYALGVRTSVGSVNIDLAAGRIRIGGLEVANPAGFEDPVFVRLGAGAFHMPLRNVLEPTIHVSLLALDGIDVNVTRTKAGSNYGTILSHLKQFESTEKAAEQTKSEKRLVIDELRITDVTAALHQEILAGQAAKVEVTVPEILLRDVGSKSGGVTAAELSGIVTKAVLDAVARAGGVPGAILGDLTSNLSGLAGVNIQLPEGIGAATGAAVELSRQLDGEAGRRLGETLDGLGGLFGKPKQTEPE